MIFTVVISAVRLEDGKEVRYYFPLQRSMAEEREAKEWGAVICMIRFPEAPNGEWSDHRVLAFNRSEAVRHTERAIKCALGPEDPFVPKDMLALQHHAILAVDFHPPLPEPTTPQQPAALVETTQSSNSDSQRDWKPERIQAIVYAWWSEVRPTITDRLFSWSATPNPAFRAGMLLDLFMKSSAAMKDCMEIYSLAGDIKRHAEPAIKECCK